MTQVPSTHSRPNNRPPAPVSRGVRVVATADLRRLHWLLLAILGMETVDLTINLTRVWR